MAGVFRDRLKAAGLFHKLGQQKYQHMPTSEVRGDMRTAALSAAPPHRVEGSRSPRCPSGCCCCCCLRQVVRCLIIDLANDPRNGHGGSSGSFGAIPEDFDEEAAGLVSGATSLNGNGTKYGSS